MSGQSAGLSLKEAKAMQERVQQSGSHAQHHGANSGDSVHKKKTGHTSHHDMPENCHQ